MKVLLKKFGKQNIIKKIFYILTSLGYLGLTIYLIYALLHLPSIETTIRIIVGTISVIWFFIYVLAGLLTMLSQKTKTFVFLTIITILLCPIYYLGSTIITEGYKTLNNMVKNELEYTTNLIALKETNFKSTSKIGMIAATNDIEGNQLAKKLAKKYNLTNKVINTYVDYQSLIHDLYTGEIDACYVSSNFPIIFNNEDYEDNKGNPLKERVKILYEYTEELKNQDSETLSASKEKSLTEPFTMLIMGVDSTYNGLKANQAFNGDTLIMVTFNPNTLTATMFSIPRDTYVPIACNGNRYNKINSSAAYGSSCVINTIQNLTGVKIDYYLKVNFLGVVHLIDALGGVTVNIEEPNYRFNGSLDCGFTASGQKRFCEQNSQRALGSQTVFIEPGIQKLNGEQALAYARNRHQYTTSDIARNQHQQQVIEAAAQQLKTINSIDDFQRILNTVSNNIETNITPEQILSFYNVGKDMLLSSNKNSTALSIKKTYLSWYGLNVYLPNAGRHTSAVGYYPGSLNAITTLMKENLGIQKPKSIKTFKVSYNEDYSTPLVGYGINTGGRLELMKTLNGNPRYIAENYCSERGINCVFNTVTSTEPEGTIVFQSEPAGVLIKSIKKLVFEISDGKGKKEEPKDDKEETDKPDNNEDEDEDEEETTKPEDGKEDTTEPTTPSEPTTPTEPSTPTTPTVPTTPTNPDPGAPTPSEEQNTTE